MPQKSVTVTYKEKRKLDNVHIELFCAVPLGQVNVEIRFLDKVLSIFYLIRQKLDNADIALFCAVSLWQDDESQFTSLDNV